MSLTFIASATTAGVAGPTADNSSTTLDVTSSLNVQAGDLLVAYLKWEGGDTSVSVAKDTGSPANIFTFDSLDHYGIEASNDAYAAFGYVAAASADATATFRATWSAARVYKRLVVLQFRPDSGETVTREGGNHNFGNSTSLTTGNITTTGTDGVAICGYGEYAASYTSAETINGAAYDGRVDTGTNPSWGFFSSTWYKFYTSGFTGGGAATTGGGEWGGGIVAFKSSSGGGGGSPDPLERIKTVSDTISEEPRIRNRSNVAALVSVVASTTVIFSERRTVAEQQYDIVNTRRVNTVALTVSTPVNSPLPRRRYQPPVESLSDLSIRRNLRSPESVDEPVFLLWGGFEDDSFRKEERVQRRRNFVQTQSNDVTSTIALTIEQDFYVSSTVTETISSTVSFDIAGDFSVSSTVTETITSSSAFAIESDFSAAGSITVANPVSATIALSIESDFSASATVTESIPSTISASIESDFSVSTTVTETIPSTIAADITSDFSSAVAINVANPAGAIITVVIDPDFLVSASMLETIPGTVAASIESDFVVASSATETVSSSIALDITSDFSSSLTGVVANPVTSTVSAFITDDIVVAATGTSLSGGDFSAAVVITNDIIPSASLTETISGTSAFVITSDFSVSNSVIVANPVSGTIAAIITDDFSVSASGDSVQTVTGTIAAIITDDFSVQSQLVQSNNSFVTIDVTADFSSVSTITESYSLSSAIEISNDFSIVSNILSIQDVNASIVIDITDSISSHLSITISNPSILTGTIVEAVWRSSTAPQAKWL